jgi:hypothetical protein
MTVTFRVRIDLPDVEMSNATASIVIAMLGRDGSGALEGSMQSWEVLWRIDQISPGEIEARAVPPRQLAPDEVDHGTSAAWLRDRLEVLYRLAFEAFKRGVRFVEWE